MRESHMQQIRNYKNVESILWKRRHFVNRSKAPFWNEKLTLNSLISHPYTQNMVLRSRLGYFFWGIHAIFCIQKKLLKLSGQSPNM